VILWCRAVAVIRRISDRLNNGSRAGARRVDELVTLTVAAIDQIQRLVL
jgi:hypothetical protein